MCVGVLYFFFNSLVNLRDALLALPIPSAKIVWRQDGMHRKERKRERESARGRGKEEERKTSAEAIGGASAAAAAILKKSPWTSLKNSTAVAVGAPLRPSLFVHLPITTALLSLPMQLGS
jgi:hypothetical protein